LTNPLITRRDASLFDHIPVPVLNPISEGLEVLRPSLVPSMLKVISHNIKRGARDMRLFEVARVFYKTEEVEGSLDCLKEKEVLVVALTGSRFPSNWSQEKVSVDFFDIKGSVEMLFERLNLLDKSALNIYNDCTLSITFDLMDEGERLKQRGGSVKEIAPEVLDAFDIDQPVFIAEIDAELLESCYTLNVVYNPPSRYPVVVRDLSFILPEGSGVQELVDCVKSSDEMIRKVQVFDLFERETEPGERERSVALSLDISDPEGTLKEERVKKILRKVTDNVESRLGAVIRQV